ncbi:MAG: ABC transporter substrate-binding protein [Magnetococcales bacterium]|nr:ABC transporter substrate-binding protein [Magnetococcales bacterium]
MQTKHQPSPLNRRQFLTHTAAGGVALGLGLFGMPALAVAKKPLTIGYIPIMDHLILAASHARDNANLTGIDVLPRMFKSWGSAAGALEAGVIDGAFLLSNLAMDMFNRGVPIRTILVGHRNGSALVVRADAAITEPQALAGKTVAIPARISTHTALLDSYLRRGGLSLQAIKTLEVAPPLMVEAMMRNTIDAFIVAEPFCAKAEQEKVGKILTFSKDIQANHICCVLVMRNEALAANPAGIQEWVNGLVHAGQWLDQQKGGPGAGEIAKLAGRYMPYPESLILASLQHPSDRIIYRDLLPRPTDFQAIVDISVRAGMLQPVALDRFIDDRFVKGQPG